MILDRICLQKIFFQNLGFPVQLYTTFKAAHFCIYFGFSQKQETNKSMRYDSCQNLLTKNLFPNLGFLCSYIQNLIAAHSCIYFGFSQKQETNKSMRYDSCQDLAYT